MRTVKDIDKGKYMVTEKPVHMKSDINKIVHYTPKLTEEEYRRTKKDISSELYDIFKKYAG